MTADRNASLKKMYLDLEQLIKAGDIIRLSPEFKRHLAFQQELIKAGDRIGAMPDRMGRNSRNPSDGAMRWLLQFCEQDLSKLSEGDLVNRRYEASYLSQYGVPDRTPALYPILTGKAAHLDWLPLPSLFETFQKAVKRAVHGILDKEMVIFEIPSLKLALIHIDGGRDYRGGALVKTREERWVLATNTEEEGIPYTYAIAHLLKEHAMRIRRCPDCHTPFLADRRNQDYCSKRCQGRVAIREYRARQAKKKRTTKKGAKRHGTKNRPPIEG